jgi:hypothetical protein
MTDLDIIGRKRSVTFDDIDPTQGPGVLHVLVGPSDFAAFSSFIPQTGLPIRTAYPYPRDVLLSATPLMDNMWAVASKKAISKQVALGYTISDSKDIGTRTARTLQIYDEFDGNFEMGIQRHLQDFLFCDNGAWVEIARATRGGASRVEGIYHLDSLRVVRTRDPNIPAYYLPIQGGYKPLPAEFVQSFTDMPSPRVELAGVGLCAASTAWDTIVKMQAVETYFREKVTGNNQRAIFLISGVTRKQLKEGIESADADAVSRGIIVYKGAVMIPGFNEEHPPQFVQIDLASIPDNFNLVEERERSDRIFAYALGVPLPDIQPLTGQGLGNGQQARLLDESAEAQGLAAWRKQWQSFTKKVNPHTTTFTWSTNDLTDKKKKADLQKVQSDMIIALVEKGLINVPAGQQLLLDMEILPKELAPADITPGGQLTDEQQPSDATEMGGQSAVAEVMSAVSKDSTVADLVARYKALSDEAAALGLEPAAWTTRDKTSAVIANDPPELSAAELAAAKRLLEQVIR